MKLWDWVRVTADKDEYKSAGVTKGMVGYITDAEIRYNAFNVAFDLPDDDFGEFAEWINIEDLELVKECNATDERILRMIPQNNPEWWCKVEEGYIVNLKGDRKNKIPYKYNS